MMKNREWFWEIEEMKKGPDFVFLATFAPSDAEKLARLVADHLPSGFIENKEFSQFQNAGDVKVYHSYLDEHTYHRLIEMQETGNKENIWYYGEIEIRDHVLTIQQVLAGGMYKETPLIVALAQACNLTWQEWRIIYGDSSWGWSEAARGNDASSLLDYLHYSDATTE
jgi:hypothetical protein